MNYRNNNSMSSELKEMQSELWKSVPLPVKILAVVVPLTGLGLAIALISALVKYLNV